MFEAFAGGDESGPDEAVVPGDVKPFYVSDLTDWSPLKEIQGPELPPDEWAGYWELVWRKERVECPSMYEVVDYLSTHRSEIVTDGGVHKVELRWRAP